MDRPPLNPRHPQLAPGASGDMPARTMTSQAQREPPYGQVQQIPRDQPESSSSRSQLTVPTLPSGSFERGPAQKYVPYFDVTFPAHANLTAAELLTFIPNCIRSPDVIHRLVSHGATPQILWRILHTHCTLGPEDNLPAFESMIQRMMRNNGYQNWTFRNHQRRYMTRQAAWNEMNLNMAGYLPPRQVNVAGSGAAGISFSDLALHIKQTPQGADALDLTRMVEHCVQTRQAYWKYPSDYEDLLVIVGGAATVRPEHRDIAAFARWLAPEPAVGLTIYRTIEPWRLMASNEVLERGNSRVSRESSSVREKSASPVLAPQSTKAQPQVVPARTRISGIGSQRSQRTTDNKSAVGSEPRHVQLPRDKEPYVRPVADYVAPIQFAIKAPDSVVRRVFREEGNQREYDAFSAYAFEGPRQRRPFRMLHHMSQPDKKDYSGWAENLRWAFEQRACFSHTYRVDGWNESPEHMEQIAAVRKQQVWASEELADKVAWDQEIEEGARVMGHDKTWYKEWQADINDGYDAEEVLAECAWS